MSTCSVLCKILFCHEANPLFTCYLHACSSNTNFTIFDDWRKFWAINQSFNNKFRKLYYPTLVSVWCLAGEEKTRFAWHWGRERVANRLKKSAMKTGFSVSGIYDRESGFQSNTGARFQIESMHGKRVPKILQRLRQKKNTIVRGYQRFWKLSNWSEKNSQEKGPMATTASSC